MPKPLRWECLEEFAVALLTNDAAVNNILILISTVKSCVCRTPHHVADIAIKYTILGFAVELVCN